MKKTPLTLVKEQFGDKQKLVDAVQKLATEDMWLDRVSGEKGLSRISNAKLLRLHAALTSAKKNFGSRDKLIGSILDSDQRTKDEGMKARLASYPLPRLLDLQRVGTRRSKAAAAATKTAKAAPAKPKKKLARSKKARAKAAAASR